MVVVSGEGSVLHIVSRPLCDIVNILHVAFHGDTVLPLVGEVLTRIVNIVIRQTPAGEWSNGQTKKAVIPV